MRLGSCDECGLELTRLQPRSNFGATVPSTRSASRLPKWLSKFSSGPEVLEIQEAASDLRREDGMEDRLMRRLQSGPVSDSVFTQAMHALGTLFQGN